VRLEIAAGARAVGGGDCFVIAEAGVNHDGDLASAHALVDAAADSGADAVKFQTFDPALVVAPGARKAAYQAARTGAQESQLEMLARLALPHGAFAELQAHAVRRGLVFLSTPFDEPSADFLFELGMPAFKVASGELTNHGFLAHLARKGRPMVVSTGMSTLAEVAAAVEVIRGAGAPPLALLHCVSSYPADAADCNLRAIDTLASAFGCPVGWSDHTPGIEIAIAAVGRGAAILEKHLTTSRSRPGPDHPASLEPAEFAALVAAVRRVARALGDGVKRPAESESDTREIARRSLFLREARAAGHALRERDLVALRPATGIPAEALAEIVGRRLRVALAAGAQLSIEDLD